MATTAKSRQLCKAALSYTKLGWSVIPLHSPKGAGCSCKKGLECSNAGKHPRTRRGFKDATRDPATIRGWWKRWPDANVGIVTGKESSIVVIDVDGIKGGEDTLSALERTHGKLPDTVEALTGGGGRHVVFAHPGCKIRCSAGSLGPGLDVRGDGGYIVAQPSLHASGKEYSWELSSVPEETELADMPRWLQDKLAEKKSPRKRTATSARGPIPRGERNVTLTTIGGKMRARGKEREEILAALIEINRKRCAPPLSAREVKSIAKSVARYDKEESFEARRLVCFERDLISSSAYIELSGKAPQLLALFYARRQMEEGKILNNGRIRFTYAEAEKKHGISKDQFRRARDQLIEKGFINIAQNTSPTLYAISKRWRKYGTPKFEQRTRQKSKIHPLRFMSEDKRNKWRKERQDAIAAARRQSGT